MTMLLSLLPFPYRMLALALLAVALVGFGWVKGAHHEEAKFEAYKARQMADAAMELSKRLAQQTDLQRKNEGIANDLLKAKRARAADAIVVADKLRDYESAAGSARSIEASACPGIASPFAAIAGECIRAFAALDEHDKGLAITARSLQRHEAEVCVGVLGK
jgi:hypothetical protein